MFKPGDKALVVSTGKHTAVKAVLRDSTKVETEDGLFEEADLRQAHPTVLDNANPKYLTPEEQNQKLMEEVRARPQIDYALRNEVEGLLKAARLEFDFRGHWKNGEAIYDRERFLKGVMADLFLFGFKSDEGLRTLKGALTSKKALDHWIRLGTSMSVPSDGCSYCGARRFAIETNGKALRLSGDDCPVPDGFGPNEWELNVPSGKIVVANDLRQWFPLAEGDGDIASINTILGCRQTAQAYAAAGMSHAFVGNTCPGVFKLADGRFKIACEPSDEVWDGEEWVERTDGPTFEGERVAGVCTDLWWYSLCDADEFQRRIEKFGKADRDAVEVVDVKPGVYRFRHFDGVNRDDYNNETVFATFEWVREADPVKDFLKEWESVDVNPNAYVQSQVRRWPTLFGAMAGSSVLDEQAIPWSEMTEEQKLHSWQRVADHVFCTIGGGVKWHEKGFPKSKVDPEVPDVEPPSFRLQCHWYPFSKPYGGLFTETLSPSFAKLAFRVLESVISFGMRVNDGSHSREVPYARERMGVAVQRYRELAKKYPAEADPDYVWWLNQPGRAEAWVERFDLGPVFTEKHRKHAEAQRWIPEGTYAIEFDARKLQSGHFAWAAGHWARKEDAERYAINEWHDNEQAPEHNCFWSSHAKNTAIPLYSVARVVKLGEVSHMGSTIVELAFDYGTPWMQDVTKRKGVAESGEKDAIRLLTKEEYEKLLPEAKKFFAAKPKKKAAAKKTSKKKVTKKAAKRAPKKSKR